MLDRPGNGERMASDVNLYRRSSRSAHVQIEMALNSSGTCVVVSFDSLDKVFCFTL